MDINQAIRSFAPQPLTHQLLMSLLQDYKRPNDKIHSLLSEGVIQPIKKGLYIAGPAINSATPEPFLLANHILGPSYISLDSALSHHGLIPERVFEITSVTTKAARRFNTSVGIYSYTRLPLPYYSFGIQQLRLADDQYAMIASPEKALFDKIVCTSGLVLRSQKSAMSYLLEDLRIDETNLKGLNTNTMLGWLPDSPKRDSLLMIIKMINNI